MTSFLVEHHWMFLEYWMCYFLRCWWHWDGGNATMTRTKRVFFSVGHLSQATLSQKLQMVIFTQECNYRGLQDQAKVKCSSYSNTFIAMH
jgi:hypothetical protein